MGSVFSDFPKALAECKELADPLRVFKDWASIFVDPERLYTQLLRNVPEHFPEIWAQVQEAMKNFLKDDYYEYGKNLSRVLVLAVGEAKPGLGIVRSIDKGYSKFKDWIDHYILPSRSESKVEGATETAVDMGKKIIDSFKNLKPWE